MSSKYNYTIKKISNGEFKEINKTFKLNVSKYCGHRGNLYFDVEGEDLPVILDANLFYGVSLVMGVDFSLELFIISLLVGILTLILLLAHAFMDFDSDKEVNKKTLLVRLGTKERDFNFLYPNRSAIKIKRNSR